MGLRNAAAVVGVPKSSARSARGRVRQRHGVPVFSSCGASRWWEHKCCHLPALEWGLDIQVRSLILLSYKPEEVQNLDPHNN